MRDLIVKLPNSPYSLLSHSGGMIRRKLSMLSYLRRGLASIAQRRHQCSSLIYTCHTVDDDDGVYVKRT